MNDKNTIVSELNALWLGTVIIKYKIPVKMIDDINNAYDEKLKELTAHNKELVGQIKE